MFGLPKPWACCKSIKKSLKDPQKEKLQEWKVALANLRKTELTRRQNIFVWAPAHPMHQFWTQDARCNRSLNKFYIRFSQCKLHGTLNFTVLTDPIFFLFIPHLPRHDWVGYKVHELVILRFRITCVILAVHKLGRCFYFNVVIDYYYCPKAWQ